MRTKEVIVAALALEAEGPNSEDFLLDLVTEGLISAPHGLETGEPDWPAHVVPEAVAVDTMLFRHGFQRDAVKIARMWLLDKLITPYFARQPGRKSGDLITELNRIAEDDQEQYIPCVLWALAFGKAAAGIPANEVGSVETWVEDGRVKFRRATLEVPDGGDKHPRIVECIVRRSEP